MNMYVEADGKREVVCEKCGNKYTERLYEYIGGPKYWSGRCSCTPISIDSIVKYLESEINKFNGSVVTDNWNIELIENVNKRIKCFPKKKGRCRMISVGSEEYFYPNVYPSKKDISNYIGEDTKSFYKKHKEEAKDVLFVKEVLDISIEEYIHYISYLIEVRNKRQQSSIQI